MYFGFKNLTINYGKKKIIDDISIDFPCGKIITIIGQNGCGKSSMLKTISRMVKPKSGSVIYLDKELKTYKNKYIAKKIAYLPQVHNYPSDIDVRTLVSYGRYPHQKMGKKTTHEDSLIIDEALRMTGLTNIAYQSVSTLSGGERQRAFIAMTITQQPDILILDEPTTYLDISFQVEVLELIKFLNKELGITIIMVLHDLNLASRYSDYIYAIKDHKVYISGNPYEVINEKNLEDIFSIKANIFIDEVNNCPFFIPIKTVN